MAKSTPRTGRVNLIPFVFVAVVCPPPVRLFRGNGLIVRGYALWGPCMETGVTPWVGVEGVIAKKRRFDCGGFRSDDGF